MISRATGIEDRSLRARNYNECSVAERMSWAANRQTSRIEDQAYSLLGLFGVSMPLLYGERDRAFVRLQEEIIKRSDDQSIFCWDKMISSSDNVMGLLAPHPHCFGQRKSIVYNASDPRHISTTNRGHSIEVKLAPWTVDTFVALLNCYDTYGTPKCIFLRFITVGQGFHYARVLVDGYSCANSNPGFQPMLLREMATVSSLRIVHVVDSHGLNERMKRVMAERLNGFRLDCISARDAITITDHIICGSWSKQWQAVYSEPRLESWPIAVLRLAIPGCKAKCIILGFLPMPGGRSEPAVVFTEREDTVLEVRKLLYDVPRALGDEPPPASVLRHLPPPLAFGPPQSFGSSPRRLHPSGRTSDKTWAAIMQPEQERILVTLEEGHSDAEAEMYFGIEPTSASVDENTA